jgi:heme/copper-type cytochrome/quinol oxidase subunit 4
MDPTWNFVITFIFTTGLVYLARTLAINRNRNRWTWMGITVFLGVISVVVLYFMPMIKEEAAIRP